MKPARLISLFLAIVYLSNQVALEALAQSSIWEERRRAFRNTNPALLASLPRPLNFVNTSTFPKQRSTPKSSVKLKPGVPLPASFKPLIENISSPHATVRDVYVAPRSDHPPIVLLQDVHLNAEAQNNIAAVLNELLQNRQISLVGVEGAFGPFDFAEFRSFSDKRILEEVSRAFLNENYMGAPSYVGINSPIFPPAFTGVDDAQAYEANIETYLNSEKQQKEAEETLQKLKTELDRFKKQVFSKNLLRFDNLKSKYHNKQLSLGEYLRLSQDFAQQEGIRLPSTIQNFLKAYEIECQLDFKQVERERRFLMERLTAKLKDDEAKALLSQSLAYRMGSISFGDYFGDLRKLCEKKGLLLGDLPYFQRYFTYILLADGIKAEDLFAEIRALEQDLFNRLARSERERTLLAQSRSLTLTKKLTHFELTPEEWEEYKEMRNADFRIQNKMKNSLSNPKSAFKNLRLFEVFYELADLRSRKMVENLLNAESNKAVNSAFLNLKSKILVIGGFHTPDIARQLKERGLSYIVVSPKLTKVEDASGTAYLSLFAREKTPLEKLFAGEKLFIYPARNNIGARNTPRALPHTRAMRRVLSDLNGQNLSQQKITREWLRGWIENTTPSPGVWAGFWLFIWRVVLWPVSTVLKRVENHLRNRLGLVVFMTAVLIVLATAEGALAGYVAYKTEGAWQAALIWALPVNFILHGFGIWMWIRALESETHQAPGQIVFPWSRRVTWKRFLTDYMAANFSAASSLLGFVSASYGDPLWAIMIFAIVPHIAAVLLVLGRSQNQVAYKTPRWLRERLAEWIDPGRGRRILEAEERVKKAQRLADLDPLTKLLNLSALQRELPKAEADPSMAVIVFDANNFGQINKKVNQEAGDFMLVEVAATIREAAADFGVIQVFRKGGDEFVVLAPIEVAGSIRILAEDMFGEVEIEGVTISISGTIGATFNEADALLQERKKQRKTGVSPRHLLRRVFSPAKHKLAAPKIVETMPLATGETPALKTLEKIRRKLADWIDPERQVSFLRIERRAQAVRRLLDRDPLTRLGNHAALERALPSAESDPDIAVIAFDANNFGLINKRVSQEAGDLMIRVIAGAIREAAALFGISQLFRRGGDEFVVLAPRAVAEQLRDAAEQLFGEPEVGGVRVSLSGTVAETFNRADESLQARKIERKMAAAASDGKQKGTPATWAFWQWWSGVSKEEAIRQAPFKESFWTLRVFFWVSLGLVHAAFAVFGIDHFWATPAAALIANTLFAVLHWWELDESQNAQGPPWFMRYPAKITRIGWLFFVGLVFHSPYFLAHFAFEALFLQLIELELIFSFPTLLNALVVMIPLGLMLKGGHQIEKSLFKLAVYLHDRYNRRVLSSGKKGWIYSLWSLMPIATWVDRLPPPFKGLVLKEPATNIPPAFPFYETFYFPGPGESIYVAGLLESPEQVGAPHAGYAAVDKLRAHYSAQLQPGPGGGLNTQTIIDPKIKEFVEEQIKELKAFKPGYESNGVGWLLNEVVKPAMALAQIPGRETHAIFVLAWLWDTAGVVIVAKKGDKPQGYLNQLNADEIFELDPVTELAAERFFCTTFKISPTKPSRILLANSALSRLLMPAQLRASIQSATPENMIESIFQILSADDYHNILTRLGTVLTSIERAGKEFEAILRALQIYLGGRGVDLPKNKPLAEEHLRQWKKFVRSPPPLHSPDAQNDLVVGAFSLVPLPPARPADAAAPTWGLWHRLLKPVFNFLNVAEEKRDEIILWHIGFWAETLTAWLLYEWFGADIIRILAVYFGEDINANSVGAGAVVALIPTLLHVSGLYVRDPESGLPVRVSIGDPRAPPLIRTFVRQFFIFFISILLTFLPAQLGLLPVRLVQIGDITLNLTAILGFIAGSLFHYLQVRRALDWRGESFQKKSIAVDHHKKRSLWELQTALDNYVQLRRDSLLREDIAAELEDNLNPRLSALRHNISRLANEIDPPGTQKPAAPSLADLIEGFLNEIFDPMRDITGQTAFDLSNQITNRLQDLGFPYYFHTDLISFYPMRGGFLFPLGRIYKEADSIENPTLRHVFQLSLVLFAATLYETFLLSHLPDCIMVIVGPFLFRLIHGNIIFRGSDNTPRLATWADSLSLYIQGFVYSLSIWYFEPLISAHWPFLKSAALPFYSYSPTYAALLAGAVPHLIYNLLAYTFGWTLGVAGGNGYALKMQSHSVEQALAQLEFEEAHLNIGIGSFDSLRDRIREAQDQERRPIISLFIPGTTDETVRSSFGIINDVERITEGLSQGPLVLIAESEEAKQEIERVYPSTIVVARNNQTTFSTVKRSIHQALLFSGIKAGALRRARHHYILTEGLSFPSHFLDAALNRADDRFYSVHRSRSLLIEFQNLDQMKLNKLNDILRRVREIGHNA